MANPRTIARLEAQIRRRASHCLQFELADPRASFITITRVELAKDLSSGRIFYSVLGDDSEISRTEHLLASAAGFIQRRVASVLSVRNVPHLRWVYDDSIAEAARLDRLIREARARDREINPALAAEESDPLDRPLSDPVAEGARDEDEQRDEGRAGLPRGGEAKDATPDDSGR